ncbi:MAG: FtsW/RodA/SpoVE family cell cycle protein [Armatimonadota bacterium]|nr:FtsW/RodA/SpoVE family cell cycle protein [Armatimonadota bacterium]
MRSTNAMQHPAASRGRSPSRRTAAPQPSRPSPAVRNVTAPRVSRPAPARTAQARRPETRTTLDRDVMQHVEHSRLKGLEAHAIREPRSSQEGVLRLHPSGPVTHQAAETKCPPCHWGLFVATLLLAVLSVPLVYSASTAIALENHSRVDYFLWRQLQFICIGLGTLVVASLIPSRQMRKVMWALYLITIVGLLATTFSPFGLSLGGVRRWLKLGPVLLQMSELAKIALIGVLAAFWSHVAHPERKPSWPWLVAGLLTLPLFALVFIQPHLSAALLLFLLPFCVGFYAAAPWKQMIKIVTPFVLLAGVTFGLCKTHQMPLLKPYQQDRIVAFVSGGGDDRGADYQALQGQRALTRGGLFGSGPGASLFKQGHLPAPHTDFILAVIGEEWGLLGVLTLLLIYGTMIFFCFQIGHSAGTTFEALLCAGIGTLLAIQVVCNVAVVTGLMPVTGMPLPLLSYGGSGFICTLLGLGLVLSVSRQAGNSGDSARAIVR